MSVFTNPAGRDPEASREYVSALLGLLGGRDPVEVMAEQTRALDTLVTGRDDRRLRTPEAPGKWSVIQVLAHLADTEMVYAWRYRLCLAQEQPPLTGFDQDAWARTFHYRDWPLAPTLERLRVAREANLDLLRSLAPDQWARTGLHNERGPESVRRTAELGAAHDLLHRNQIARILGAIA